MHIARLPLGLALFTHWLGRGSAFRSTLRQLYRWVIGLLRSAFLQQCFALVLGKGVLCTFVHENIGVALAYCFACAIGRN